MSTRTFIRLQLSIPKYIQGSIKTAYGIDGGEVVGYCPQTREWLKWSKDGELHDSFAKTRKGAADLVFEKEVK